MGKYTDKPVEYNDMYQAQENYVGNDKLNQEVLKKGSLVMAVELPNGGGDYFMTHETLNKYKNNAADLSQALQVGCWVDDDINRNPEGIGTYKGTAKVYYVKEDTLVASGSTTQNPQYGKGGEEQIVIPHARGNIQEYYKNSNNKDFKKDKNTIPGSLIPVNLAKGIDKAYLQDEAKTTIDSLQKEYKDAINKEDGYIKLDNTIVNREVAQLFRRRDKIHTSYQKINCIKYELAVELHKAKLDGKFIDDLNNILKQEMNGMKKLVKKFKNDVTVIKNSPNLAYNFKQEQIKHLMSEKMIIPNDIVKQRQYLNQKIKAFNQIQNSDRVNFVINDKMEKDIHRTYQKLTSEPDYETKEFEGRKLIHIQSAPSEKKQLLGAYREKVIVNKALAENMSDNTKKKATSLLNKIENKIESIIKVMEHKGQTLGNQNIDDKIKYQKRMADTPENEFNKDLNMEKNINRYIKNEYIQNNYKLIGSKQKPEIKKRMDDKINSAKKECIIRNDNREVSNVKVKNSMER